MKEGKKNKAYKIILKTLDRLSLFGILGRVNLSLFKERLSRGSGSLVSLLRKPPIRPRRPRFAKQINRGAKIEWNEWNERSNIRMRSRLPITRSASTPVHKQSATFASKLTIRPGPEGAFGALTDSNNAAHHRKRQKHAIAPLLTPLVEGPLHIAEGTVRFVKAIENVKPTIEVRKVRISGTTQLVPSIIPNNRQKSLAIRWLIEAAIQRHNAKKSMTLDQCFFVELLEAYQNTGSVRKRRDDLHKLAESNRGFAHYRWWNR
jgi:ribosomal protein S7